MIIKLLLDLIYKVLSILTQPISIPSLPEQAVEYIETFFGYLESGAGIVASFTPYGYLLTLLGVVVGIDVGIKIYHLVMWILKKIPMLGVQ